MIRGIIFDCFGVLYRGSLTHLSELAAPEDQQAVYDLSHASDYGFISHDDYFRQLGELVHKPAREVEAIIRERHIRSDEMVELARELRRTYKVALLSNVGQGVMDELFSADERRELFDAIVLSSDIGMVKPHPEIYEYAARQLLLLPEECIMIDDLPVNIEGARQVGMRGIVCQSVVQLRKDLKQYLTT
jgi:HAD superfamily hydrolase (TIGR01509 family)